MKPITMYQADDGSIHATTLDAVARDHMIAECAAVETELQMRPAPDTSEFRNGEGFIQHPTGTRQKLTDRLRGLGANRDSTGPVGLLLGRLWAMDAEDREWGQPYFAKHPAEGKQVAL